MDSRRQIEEISSTTVLSPKILVVDDERVITDILSDFLSLEGYEIETAGSGPEALKIMENNTFDLIISDLKMEPMNGLKLLEEVKNRQFNGMVIIMTAFGTVETALEAMKKGAFDYILKPFKMEEVVQIVKRALSVKRLADENFELKEIISLYQLSEQLDVSQRIEDIVESFFDFAITHVRSDTIEIFIYDTTRENILFHKIRTREELPDKKMGSWVNPSLIKNQIERGSSIIGDTSSAANISLIGAKTLPVSFIIVPLVYRKKTIGFFVASSFSPNIKYTEGQRKFLTVIGSRASVSIANAQLVEDMKSTFRQTIQALARALEAMEKYTSRHSDRVALYSELTGKEMKLPQEQLEILINSALLHDIGKFGCHANLNKPGKLTHQEYEIFKLHPKFGVEILQPITFLKPILPGIKYHHERWDGKGYPEGLKGEEIPLIARILAVADAYDAMTSNRAYRKAMSHRVAIGELHRCSGTQFDPKIVEYFIRAIENYRKEATKKGIPIPQ